MIGRAEPVAAEVLVPNNDDEIVYFDGDHVIRIFDPVPTSDVLQVEWASPTGGWGDIALGDFTGDGDMEIVAIRQDGNGGRLTIFDPVAQDSPEDLVQMLDGVPWAILYELALPSPPRLIASGEFDPSNSVREILYSFALDDEFDRFVILRATGEGAPGRVWEEQIGWELEDRWSAIATGNVYVDDTVDEVGLVSFDRGEVALFRVVPEVVETFNNVNREHRWRSVAFGQFTNVNNDGDELAAVRDADFPLASTWVFRYNGTAIVDQYSEQLSPSPNVVFFADIRGNNDEEMVLLRQVRPELGPRARLIVRDGNNNDTIRMSEELLDGDNEYKGGDGGDIDGDGRDEIVVIRNNRIRIYTEPEVATTFTLIERFTNGTTVKLGNVDAAGLAQKSRLVASQTQSSAVLEPGQRSGTRSITIQDATRGANFLFTLDVQGADAWIEVTHADNIIPETLSLTFSAEGIDPGEYRGALVIDVSTANVENDPLTIDLSLTVEPVITATPGSASFVYYPCQAPLAPRDQSLVLSAQSALAYTAQIEGNPNWVTVAPEAGVLPESVVVSVDPERAPASIASVNLLVSVDLPNEPGIVHRVPILYACPSNRLLLPTVSD